MDNIITSAIPPTAGLAVAEKPVTGQIVEVPNLLNNIKVGDSILLQVMFDSDAFRLNTDLRVNLLVNNQKTPLRLHFDQPLQISADEPHRLMAKIIARPQSSMQFQLVSIDNQKPETFLLRPQTQPSAGNAPQYENGSKADMSLRIPSSATPAASAPIIKELNTSAQQLQLLPLKITPVLTEMIKTADLPQPLVRQLETAVAGTELQVEFKAVMPASFPAPKLSSAEILEPLKQILREMIAVKDNPNRFPQLVDKFTTQLQALNEHLLPAVADVKGEGKITVLETPLGQIVSQSPLKLPPQTPVVLAVRDTFIPSVVAADTKSLLSIGHAPQPLPDESSTNAPLKTVLNKFVELLHPQKIFPTLEKLNPFPLPQPETAEKAAVLSSASIPVPGKPAADNLQQLLDVLKPLPENNAALPELASKLLEKVPSLNAKMLSNMLNFARSSEQSRPEVWLGKDLVTELRTHGPEGEAVISRVADYLAVSHKEGISWRMVEIPFWDGTNISKIRLAVKKTQDDDEQENPSSRRKSGVRFLLETDFSKLGKFQFDGFSLAKDRRFDLVVRTSKTLPSDFCSHIVNLFKTSLHDVDYVGNISINVKENFIKIGEDEITQSQIRDGVYI